MTQPKKPKAMSSSEKSALELLGARLTQDSIQDIRTRLQLSADYLENVGEGLTRLNRTRKEAGQDRLLPVSQEADIRDYVKNTLDGNRRIDRILALNEEAFRKITGDPVE